jgi:hypothetical protein
VTEVDPADPFAGLEQQGAGEALVWFLVGVLSVALVVGLGVLWVRDRNAEAACTVLAGTTTDAGRHCQLKDGRTVSTR